MFTCAPGCQDRPKADAQGIQRGSAAIHSHSLRYLLEGSCGLSVLPHFNLSPFPVGREWRVFRQIAIPP